MADPLAIAIAALEDITNPKRTSLRRRDSNCVRYAASDALGLIRREGILVGGIDWERFERASGDVGGEPHER